MRTTKLIPGAIALTAFAAFAPGAAMADAEEAKATAAQHAGLAAAAGDLAGVRRHLHHTLNCLVGPDGEGFDESAGNPCGAAGGAIPQTGDDAMKDSLMAVAEQVNDALMSEDLAAAQEAATAIQGELE